MDGAYVDEAAVTYGLPLHKIVISPYLERIMRERYGDADVSLVPNAVDVNRFSTPPRGKRPRPTVGWIHAAEPLKNSDVSLQAAAILRQRFPDLHITCFGPQAPGGPLELPDGSDFVVRPSQDRIPSLYAACDVWFVSSQTEGFGLPLVEAMACRTPVVSTPVGIAETYIRDGENGFIVPIGDPEALADAASRVLSWDDARWRVASEAARDTVASYTLDEAVERFEAALVETVRRDRREHVPMTRKWARL
jgi:glycosyltransferase involved in cell wall biosynthesis